MNGSGIPFFSSRLVDSAVGWFIPQSAVLRASDYFQPQFNASISHFFFTFILQDVSQTNSQVIFSDSVETYFY